MRRTIQAARGVFVVEVARVLRRRTEQLVHPRLTTRADLVAAAQESPAAPYFVAKEVVAADASPPRHIRRDRGVGMIADVQHAVPFDAHRFDARGRVLELGLA